MYKNVMYCVPTCEEIIIIRSEASISSIIPSHIIEVIVFAELYRDPFFGTNWYLYGQK